MVPQETIAHAGQHEGDGDLGVPLHKVDYGALLVQQAVLMLAETVNALAGRGVEKDLGLMDIPADGQVPPLSRGREVWFVLSKQLTSIAAQEPQTTGAGHLGNEIAILDAGEFLGDLDRRCPIGHVQQSAEREVGDPAPYRRANS